MSGTIQAMRSPHPWTAVAGSYFGYCLFGLFALAVLIGGYGWLLPAGFVLVIVPLLDRVAGESLNEFSTESFGRPQRVLLSAAPIGFVLGYTAVIVITASRLTHLTLLESWFATFSVGIIGSIGVAAAHELVHKSSAWQKRFGRLGLLAVCYLHFEINHIQSHHVWLGTDRDESTARYGESLYEFIARTVPRCLRLSWVIEVKRLAHHDGNRWSARNRMLQYLLAQVAYVVALGVFFGVSGLIFFFAQAAVAVFMLEAVAYIEHYGLMRKKLPNGRYASSLPMHSWDSYHRFSNYLEFQLQRHADHHSAPSRSQELLRVSQEAQRLPAGYPVMITIALLPPLWRRLMHPRIARISSAGNPEASLAGCE